MLKVKNNHGTSAQQSELCSISMLLCGLGTGPVETTTGLASSKLHPASYAGRPTAKILPSESCGLHPKRVRRQGLAQKVPLAFKTTNRRSAQGP